MDEIVQKLVEKLKSYGFEEVIPVQAGATICCHCGPGTLGILYQKRS